MKKILLILCFLVALNERANAFFFNGGMQSVVSVPSITLPSSGLQAIYSTIKYSGWSGNCLEVENSSSATLDIGFVNGVCDIASAMTFAGSGQAQVIKWYDQSGNGNDATQSTLANAPVFSSFNMLNSIPGITFANITATLGIPSGLATNTQSQTVFSAQAMTAASSTSALWEIGATFSTANSLLLNPANDQILDNIAFQNTGVYSNSQPQISVMVSGASTKTYQVNNTLATGITATGSFSTTGGNIGSLEAAQGYPVFAQIYMLAVYNTASIGQTTIQSNVNNLISTFKIPTSTVVGRIVYDGDSIIEGAGSTLGVNNPFQAAPSLKDVVTYRNIGMFGQPLTSSLSNETANIVNSFVSGITNVVVIEGGEADICNSGATAAATFANRQTYTTNAQSAGYSVVEGTLIYDNACLPGSTGDNQRIIFNNDVRAMTGVQIADWDSVTQLQNPQAAGYSSDGTHPTTLGYSLLAPITATAVNSYLP